jgi:hypothetical protein
MYYMILKAKNRIFLTRTEIDKIDTHLAEGDPEHLLLAVRESGEDLLLLVVGHPAHCDV